MSLSEETILKTLRQIKDPELQVNVVDLGLIYGVGCDEVDGKTDIRVIMTLTTPACPYGPELMQEVRDVLGDIGGAGHVEVQMTLSPPWGPDRMTDDARDELGMF